MPAQETFEAIVNILRSLQDGDLLHFYQEPIRLSSGPTEIVTWPNHTPGAAHASQMAFGTYAQYRAILEERSFLAILRDGSLLRASYKFRHRDLTAHSLWFWPCPLDVPRDEIMEQTPLDALDLYAADWQRYIRFRTPMRFDYDPGAACQDHPASHLHAQAHNCRIAIERPLGFAAFVRFVFRNFYCPDWNAHPDLWGGLADELPEQSRACLATSEMHSLHLAWKLDIAGLASRMRDGG